MKQRTTERPASRRATRLISRRPGAGPAKRKTVASSRKAGAGLRRRAGARTASPGRTGRSARSTTDHDEIRDWVESHGGNPATVKRTRREKQPAGILRIDFPGFSGEETLKPISWGKWFDMFEERKLTFLYQDKKNSRFNKLVSRKK